MPANQGRTMPNQARYWILTIPEAKWVPQAPIHPGIAYLKGQLEIGASGYRHWQVLAVLAKKTRKLGVINMFCREAHCEPTRSEAAEEYVWKEDTRVPDTQFAFGKQDLIVY